MTSFCHSTACACSAYPCSMLCYTADQMLDKKMLRSQEESHGAHSELLTSRAVCSGLAQPSHQCNDRHIHAFEVMTP